MLNFPLFELIYLVAISLIYYFYLKFFNAMIAIRFGTVKLLNKQITFKLNFLWCIIIGILQLL